MRMRRALVAALLGILMIFTQEQGAGAHGAFIYGTVSLQDLDLVVRIADPYGALIPEALVTAATALVDKPSPRGGLLTEGPPGTYSGRLVPPAAEVYQITLELRAGGELFRGVFQVAAGEQVDEQLFPLAHIEQGGPLPWTAYLYLFIVFLLGIALAVALRRKRLAAAEKEDE